MRKGAADKLTLVVLRSWRRHRRPIILVARGAGLDGEKVVAYTLNNALLSSKWFVWNGGRSKTMTLERISGTHPWMSVRRSGSTLGQRSWHRHRNSATQHSMAWQGRAGHGMAWQMQAVKAFMPRWLLFALSVHRNGAGDDDSAAGTFS